MKKFERNPLLYPAEQVEWEKPKKRIFIFKGPLYKRDTDELVFHELKFRAQQELIGAVKKREENLAQLEGEHKKWRPINDVAIKEAALVGKHFQKFKKKQLKEWKKDEYRQRFNSAIHAAAEAGKIQMMDPYRNYKWTLEKQIDVIVDAVRLRYLSSLKQKQQQPPQQPAPIMLPKMSQSPAFSTSTASLLTAK